MMARPTETRFEALHRGRKSAFAGRDNELGMLRRRWDWASTGKGQVVPISCEPGIGKSRLVYALFEAISDLLNHAFRFQCSPYHANSALQRFVERLQRVMGIFADDGHDIKLAKLATWITNAGQEPDTIAPLLAPYLGVDAAPAFQFLLSHGSARRSFCSRHSQTARSRWLRERQFSSLSRMRIGLIPRRTNSSGFTSIAPRTPRF